MVILSPLYICDWVYILHISHADDTGGAVIMFEKTLRFPTLLVLEDPFMLLNPLQELCRPVNSLESTIFT